MNISQLVSAVLAHAARQHEDSAWAIVTEAMTRPEIAAVVAGCHTANQAKRAMRRHLDGMLVAV